MKNRYCIYCGKIKEGRMEKTYYDSDTGKKGYITYCINPDCKDEGRINNCRGEHQFGGFLGLGSCKKCGYSKDETID